jgi:hypothetical protein
MTLRRPGQPDELLSPSTPLAEVFDAAGGLLLILGDVGVGKTTTLLQLARDLLTRAEREVSQPVPVVLPLAAWAERRLPLEQWLLDELQRHYGVSRGTGTSWVRRDQLLLLLDGLDEVRPEQRTACADAVAAFHTRHPRTPLALVSHLSHAEALRARFPFAAALVLRPPTSAQVDTYLAHGGSQSIALNTALSQRPELRPLAQNPMLLALLLGIGAEALGTVLPSATFPEQCRQLVAAYARERLERPTPPPASFPPAQAARWLAWLAQTLSRHNQAMLALEHMQPDWLPSRGQSRWVRAGAALLTGLASFALGSVAFWRAGDWPGTLLAGAVVGLGVSLYMVLVHGSFAGPIRPVDKAPALTWPSARFALGLGLGGCLVAALFTAGFGQLVSLAAGQGWAGDRWLKGGLFVGSFFGLVGMLVAFLDGQEVAARSRPNAGMWRSAQSALLSGLGFGLIAFLTGWRGESAETGLAWGLLAGPIIGLLNGGAALIQHLVLRLLLWQNGSTPPPWNYVRFLDGAVERGLLHRAGGSYLFVHAMLQQHFAGGT